MKTICKGGMAFFMVLAAVTLLLWGIGYCPLRVSMLVMALCALGMGACAHELWRVHVCEMHEQAAAKRSAWKADMFRQIENI